MRGISGSQSALREANSALIVDTVKRFGKVTQVELAEATGLSQTTVSTIVKRLVALGVVETRVTTRSGRRAQMVLLARRVGLAAGICISQRALRVVIGDFSHEVVAEQTMPLPFEHRADTTLDQAALLVVEMLERVGAGLEDLVGAGIALPAPVDTATGMVSVRGVMPGWDDIHVGHVMTKRLGRPVSVDNNANLGALGELTCGAGRPYRDFVYVCASYGTGAGIVINGLLHRGVGGTAGEIGHVQVASNGDICRCGNRGCLDTVVGATALVAPLRTTYGTLTVHDVVRLAQEGEPGPARIVSDAGATIGSVVSSLGVAINPQCVIVGGDLAETGETFLGPLREAVGRGVLPNRVAPLAVLAAELGAQSEAIGALVLALDQAEVPLLATATSEDIDDTDRQAQRGAS